MLRPFAAFVVAAFLAAGPCATLPSEAQTTAATAAALGGNVVDQQTGLAVSGATVTLFQGTNRIASTTTDANGSFSFPNEPPGLYDVQVEAVGYQSSRITDQAVLGGGNTTSIRIVVPRATSSASSLRTIGSVSTSANRNALATTTVVNRTLSADVIESEAKLRLGDALLAQSGVTSFSLDSAPGDDLNISIRGMRPSEAQTLIDGHPVGPIGVFNGTGGGFNYQLSPTSSLSSVQIAYGTGGASLLGIDAIAGTIDMLTLSPTKTRSFMVRQGIGTQGRQETVAQATGTAGRLGYAASFGVSGTYGGFSPQIVTQTGLLAGDLTSANVAANTWLVSGNYVQRNGLLKLRYDLGPTSALQFTGTSATSWDDKTGEGDNDFLTPEAAIYNAQQGGTACALPGGGSGFQVATNGGTQCFTPDQYGATFSGPYGGTPVAWQSLRLQDYDGRYTGSFGRHNIVAEAFANAFYQLYDRNYSGFTNRYQTFGERVSDDIVGDTNTIGFGYVAYHQLYQAGVYKATTGVKNQPDIGSTVSNIFLRDILNVTPKIQLFANANLKHSSVSQQTTFDPRVTLAWHTNPYDVWRLSGGRASESPTAQLKSGIPLVTTQPGAVNPQCATPNAIGTAPNPDLAPESAKELELSYGHRFRGDSQIQIVGYEQDVNNVIFSNVLPLSVFGGAALVDAATLQQYLARIATVCGANVSIANLGLTTSANAGAGRFQGIDMTGRWRFSRAFYTDVGWDITSARYFGIPVVALQNSGALREGQPLVGVPFSKGTVGFDATLKDGTEIRMDNYFVGRNNALLRTPYYYADAFASRPVGRYLTATLGISNLFNSAYDQYGRIGYAQYVPENPYYSDANAVQEYSNCCYGERFGLPQRSVMFSLTARVR
ncbi:MAG TPA: TonB-dependent receptor [Candidatus Elarobacter sp.]|nr:TonB-dependent receptor [Candidatus Elarobacter sp.]